MFPYLLKGILQMWLRLRTLRCGDYFGLSKWTNIITWAFTTGETFPAEVREKYMMIELESARYDIANFKNEEIRLWAKECK